MAVKTLQDYASLIDRVTERRQSNPSSYRTRLTLLTLLGFAVPTIALLLGLSLAGGLIAAMIIGKSFILLKLGIKLIWLPLALAFVLLRALFVRLSPPDGRRVNEQEAPSLFAAIERVRAVGDSNPVHHVLLTDELNAAVVEVPAWGLIGPSRRYLILGVQLMAALSPEQFDAVLGHEFGHLSRRHTRFSNWIYRVRMTWARLLERLEQEKSWTVALFKRFYEWYSPYYSAYSFVLAQANEYEADANGARAVGERTMADSLTMLQLQADRTQRYWGDLYQRADSQSEPPDDGVLRSYKAMAAPFAETTEAVLARALQAETSIQDTHPALRDRLDSLGQAARTPPIWRESAAVRYLDGMFEELVAEENRSWREQVAENWQEHHRESAKLRERFDALGSEELDEEQSFEKAELTERFEGGAAALPLYRAIVQQNPDHVSANFACGRILLNDGDGAGVAFLERLLESDLEQKGEPAALLYSYFVARNDHARADRYLGVLEGVQSQDAVAQSERELVGKKDILLPAELTDDMAWNLRAAVEKSGRIKKAWVVRKQVEHHPEVPCLIVVVLFKTFFDSSGRKQREALQQVADASPEDYTALVVNGKDNSWLVRKAKKVGGSRLFP